MDLLDNPNYYVQKRPYKPKLICCECRKVFKRRLESDRGEQAEERKLICPNCGRDADYVGPKFRAPKAENVQAWKSLGILQELGVVNFMGFATNRIIIPESAKSLRELLLDIKSSHEANITARKNNELPNRRQAVNWSSAIVKKIDRYLARVK